MPYRSVSLAKLLPATAEEYYAQWLASERRSHGGQAVRAFLRAHPFMFGGSVDTTAQGYARWLTRAHRSDSREAFCDYVGPRYERWRAARVAARAGRRRPAE